MEATALTKISGLRRLIIWENKESFCRKRSFLSDSSVGSGRIRLLIPPHCVQQKLATSVKRFKSFSAIKYTCLRGRTLIVSSVCINLVLSPPPPQSPPPSTHTTGTPPGQSTHPSLPTSPSTATPSLSFPHTLSSDGQPGSHRSN